MFGLTRKPDTQEAASGSAPAAPAGQRLYAVGDIHGRADLLEALIRLMDTDMASALPEIKCQVIFLGDYVDRGAGSDKVIDLLLGYRARFPETVFLKGNHEEVMLDFLADPEEMLSWIDWGGDTTLESYGLSSVFARDPYSLRDEFAAKLPVEHFEFLMDLPVFYEAGDYIFVHAGLVAGVPLAEQRQADMLWIREAFYKTRAADWGGRCIVHGHTPQGSPENKSWRINVDTGAFKTGQLTAVVLEGTDRRFICT